MRITKAFLDRFTHYGSRSDLWSDGRYTLATNGHIMVRVPRMKSVTNTFGPQWRAVWVTPDKGAMWYDIKADRLNAKLVKCEFCEGSRRGCDECEYGKTYNHKATTDIGCARFADYYLSLIATLPNIRICPTGELKSAAFKFDGGEGILMPVKK